MLLFRKIGNISQKINQKNNQEVESVTAKLSEFFDKEYYLNVNEDVRASGIDPIEHYVRFGWQEGRDPSPNFSTRSYISDHPDILRIDINPLEHFIDTLPDNRKENSSESVRDIIAKQFDCDFYQSKYAEILPDDVDPIDHFCEIGWRMGHDPNRWFSTSHYLTTNLDIKQSGKNPFWHFLVAGKFEGRAPKGSQCWQIDKASNLKSLDALKRDWMKREAAPRLLNARALIDALTPELAGKDVLFLISHDDYRTVPGGVQLCIGLEETQATSLGIRHLNIHPWQVLPTLADKDSDPVICLLLDGTSIGSARMSALIEAVSSIKGMNPSIVCHHLAGHSPEGIVAMAKAMDVASCKLWLHDYFALCTSYTLMRNNVRDCGAPDLNSNACGLCVYGEERRHQAKRFETLFEALEVCLISPSAVALKVWQDRCALVPKTIVTKPHVVLRKKKLGKKHVPQFPEPIRIGFVGALSAHKGWPVFEELKNRLADDKRFEFWVFNDTKGNISDAQHVHVHARSEEPLSTMKALRDSQIDLVLHWATWQETFSFSTFEALGAGAFVVTNAGSGNVAATVRQREAGLVLDTPEELYSVAKTDEFVALAMRSREARKSHTYALEFSDMSVEAARQEMAVT